MTPTATGIGNATRMFMRMMPAIESTNNANLLVKASKVNVPGQLNADYLPAVAALKDATLVRTTKATPP